MRSGDHYLASLRDGRAVFLDGERVDDVTKHPAFAEPIRRVAQTFDLARAADVQEATTYVDAASGRRHSARPRISGGADACTGCGRSPPSGSWGARPITWRAC
jgi:aromatic ring hydroxylase